MNNLSYGALETWEVIESLFILEKLSVLKECRMKIYNDEFLSWSSLLLINQPSSCVKMSYWLSLGLISTACLMVLYPVFERGGGGKGRRSELVQAWTYVWSMYELQWSSKVMDGKDWEPVRPFGKISGRLQAELIQGTVYFKLYKMFQLNSLLVNRLTVTIKWKGREELWSLTKRK